MFLARVRSGRFDADDWQLHAMQSYTDYPRIEAARKRLVQTAVWQGQSPDFLIPPGLAQAAQDILVSLDPNYA
ncbi:hypothetical protein [Allorhodopirellula heiligendammensis]|nr:hypothetical protein [Allorhodopirellula heiligendammensis]